MYFWGSHITNPLLSSSWYPAMLWYLMHEYHKENWRRGTTLEKSNTPFEDDDARLCAKDVDTADEPMAHYDRPAGCKTSPTPQNTCKWDGHTCMTYSRSPVRVKIQIWSTGQTRLKDQMYHATTSKTGQSATTMDFVKSKFHICFMIWFFLAFCENRGHFSNLLNGNLKTDLQSVTKYTRLLLCLRQTQHEWSNLLSVIRDRL